MPSIESIKMDYIPTTLMKQYKVSSNQNININLKAEQKDIADIDNLGDFLIEGFEEIIAHKKGKLSFPPAL